MPALDPIQDYTLLSGTESNGMTTLTFSRKFDTKDPKDLPLQVMIFVSYALFLMDWMNGSFTYIVLRLYLQLLFLIVKKLLKYLIDRYNSVNMGL